MNDAIHRQTGVVVNVSCAADRMFPDSEPYKTTTCSPLGEWVPPVPDCVCKSKYVESVLVGAPVLACFYRVERKCYVLVVRKY